MRKPSLVIIKQLNFVLKLKQLVWPLSIRTKQQLMSNWYATIYFCFHCEDKHKSYSLYCNLQQKYEDVKEACTKALSYNSKYTKALLRRAKACEHTKDLPQALEDVIAACILENFQSQSTLQSADHILKELGRQHAKEAMAKRVPIIPSNCFIKTYFMSFANDPLNTFLNKSDGDSSK